MLNHFRSAHLLEEENDVSRRRQLALLGPVLIGRSIVGMLVTHFRTKQNGGSNPVPPAERVLRVTRLGPGALTGDVVEVLVANRDVVVRSELPLQIVHNRPLRSVASERSVAAADRAIGARLRLNRINRRQNRTRRGAVGEG